MKTLKAITFITTFLLLFSCDVFLGQDADTSPEGILYSLYKDFNEKHAYVDIKIGVNPNFNTWEETYLYYKNELSKGMSLFNACGYMLRELNDPHVVLYDYSGNYITVENKYFTYKKSGYGSDLGELIGTARNLLMNDGIVIGLYDMMYGVFKEAPEIGYLFISNFDDTFTWTKEIDNIVDFFKKNTSKLIIDIRYNIGGLAPIEEYIASRFAAVQSNYLIASTKKGPGYNEFSTPMTFRVVPAENAYTKPVYLLTNKASVSAAEWFTLAMRTQPNVVHVGTNTCGAFSMRTLHPMINGWFYSISAYKVIDMEGKCYEGFGIKPHIEITGEEDPYSEWIINPETQLLAVLKLVKGDLN